MAFVKAAVGVAGSLIGGAMGSKAAEDAADTQSEASKYAADQQLTATREANAMQKQMYDQQMVNSGQSMQAGSIGLNSLLGGLGLAGLSVPKTTSLKQVAGTGQYVTTPGSPGGYQVRNSFGMQQDPASFDEAFSRYQSDLNYYHAFNSSADNGTPNSSMPQWSDYIAGGGRASSNQWVPAQYSEQSNGTNYYGANQRDLDAAYNKNYGRFTREHGIRSGANFNHGIDSGAFDKNFTLDSFYKDPSYDWRFKQGQRALEASAAARGGLLTGQGAADITNYGQGAASQEYSNAFNRYTTQNLNKEAVFSNEFNRDTQNNLNTENVFSNEYNRYNTNADNLWNRLAAVAGIGQKAIGQVNNAAQSTGQQMAGTLMTGTNATIQSQLGGANAVASGQIGSANAWNQGIGNAVNTMQTAGYLNDGWPSLGSTGGGISGYSGNGISGGISPYKTSY